MAEWHVTPDYVVANWTDELLQLMLEKLIERKDKQAKAIEEVRGRHISGGQEIEDTTLFKMMGDNVEVKNVDNDR